MGYDHFAILSIPNITDEELEIIEAACKEIRKISTGEAHDLCLFGEVHHLCAGSFNEIWWEMFDQFDQFVSELYHRVKFSIIYIYSCEFDGESLTRYEYIDGKRVKR